MFTGDSNPFFISIRAQYASWTEVASAFGINVRTITAWRAGENLMPFDVALRWSGVTNVSLPHYELIDMDQKRRAAGMLGGNARQLLYGNLGTPSGRRLGGLRAVETHRKNKTSPFIPRPVGTPRRNSDFAELVGAILGDGGITTYQLILYSNFFDEKEYSEFLRVLIKHVFKAESITYPSSHRGVIRLVCSRAEVVRHLREAGLNLGNKVERQAEVPLWIRVDPILSKACLRGLIDTDGCAYMDRHRIRGCVYTSRCIAFTNASVPLLDFVYTTWQSLGFHPTRHGRHVRLRRAEEVDVYIQDVGFSNPKHTARLKV